MPARGGLGTRSKKGVSQERSESTWASVLSATAAVARQAAAGEKDVLQAVGIELHRIGLNGAVSLLAPDGWLEIQGRWLTAPIEKALRRLTGMPIAGFRFDPGQVDLYKQALGRREAVFSQERAVTVGQLTPKPLHPLLPVLMRLLGNHPVIVAPLVTATQVLGAINVSAPWLTVQDAPMVMALADHIAIALEHVRARADMEAALERERLRNLVAETVASALDLPEVLHRVIRLAVEVTHAQAGAIALVDPDGQTLRFPILHGLPSSLRFQPLPRGHGVTWQTIESRQPMLLTDYPKHEGAIPAWVEAGIRAVLGVPLVVGEEAIGGIGLFSFEEGRTFSSEEVEAIQPVARMAAIAVKNARLYSEATLRAEELQALFRIARSISSLLDLESALTEIARQAMELFRADASRIHLLDKDRAVLRCVVALHPQAEAVKALEVLPGQGLTGYVLQTGEPLLVNDTARHPQALQIPGTPEDEAEALALAPLVLEEQTIGVMTVQRFGTDRPFDPADLRLLTGFAAQAAIAIENANLYGQIESQAQRLESEVVQRTRDLALSEARYRSLVETSLAGIFQTDNEGRLQYANQPLLDLLGRALGDLIGQPIIDFVEPSQRSSITERLAQLIYQRTSGRQVHDLEMLSADGHSVPVLFAISLIRDADGKPQGVTGVVFDISLRKTLEGALQAERDRLHAILTNIGDAVIVAGPDWTIEYVNPAWERLNGFTSAEVAGKTPTILRSWEQPPSFYEEMSETVQAGRTWRGGLINRRKDGSRYHAALAIRPVKDESGQIINFVGILHDISALKELDRLKSQFVSDASHELRTPLTNIRLYVDLLSKSHEKAKSARYLKTLGRESDRLASLIDNLLSLSRLEVGSTPLQTGPVDLNRLLSDLAEDRRTLAAGRGLELTIEQDAHLPLALGDPRLLGQVFTNLLTNAIHFTPGQGQITLRTTGRVARDGSWVIAEVQDSGLGISAEELPLVFRRFFRGQASRHTGTPGTGLGLAICKEIVEQHGGRITVESEGIPGRGSRFTVWLPAVTAS